MNQHLSKTIHFLNRNTGFIILIVVIFFGFFTSGLIRDTKVISQNTNDIVVRQREALCLLVVHAEESPDVLITQDIRDLCGDIFRAMPPGE